MPICRMVVLPFVKTIAFGGVPIGNSSARETDIATGARTYMGALPLLGPTQARAGSKIFAAATLDIRLVMPDAAMLAKMTSGRRPLEP